MASEVDITNLALGHFGNAGRVAAINPPEQSVEAEYAFRFYPMARDALLEMHDWSFAKKRAALAQLSVTPPAAWLYAYALPSDCLKPRRVQYTDEVDDTHEEPFETEVLSSGARVLYTNVPDVVLHYTYSLKDTTRFSPLFTVALSWLLGSYMAGPIVKGKTGAQIAGALLEQFAKMYLPQAKVSDANAKRSNKYKDFIPAHIRAR